ncbi:hypothetical protein [Aestuariivirga sp.]|uniref:hypothetical protein n=1 Tax=Aestuariivirga sp. TaxID=2650926 RepID=UPI003BAB31F5
MFATTCAACDCELDGGRIHVEIGRNAVEVCCEACAQALREAERALKRDICPQSHCQHQANLSSEWQLDDGRAHPSWWFNS